MHSEKETSLVRLGRLLLEANYEFATVTPLTHRRVLRRGQQGEDLRDIFGWNKSFELCALDERMKDALYAAAALQTAGSRFRSGVRAATLKGQLFLHSAFPTEQENAVFFGPDSYRFVRLLEASLERVDRSGIRKLVDIGCGSGVGGIALRRILGPGSDILLGDINEHALRFSRLNTVINDVADVTTVYADVLDGLPSDFDLVVSNPPYLVDDAKRLYRHGGGDLGFDLSLRIIEEGIQHLRTGGCLVLYTGSAVVDGRDLFKEALRPVLTSPSLNANYFEIDPDVFGEELDRAPYHCADRIAVVAVQLIKR